MGDGTTSHVDIYTGVPLSSMAGTQDRDNAQSEKKSTSVTYLEHLPESFIQTTPADSVVVQKLKRWDGEARTSDSSEGGGRG